MTTKQALQTEISRLRRRNRTLLDNYRELGSGLRIIRKAVELCLGPMPSREHAGVTPLQEAEAITRAIVEFGQRYSRGASR